MRYNHTRKSIWVRSLSSPYDTYYCQSYHYVAKFHSKWWYERGKVRWRLWVCARRPTTFTEAEDVYINHDDVNKKMLTRGPKEGPLKGLDQEKEVSETLSSISSAWMFIEVLNIFTSTQIFSSSGGVRTRLDFCSPLLWKKGSVVQERKWPLSKLSSICGGRDSTAYTQWHSANTW